MLQNKNSHSMLHCWSCDTKTGKVTQAVSFFNMCLQLKLDTQGSSWKQMFSLKNKQLWKILNLRLVT